MSGVKLVAAERARQQHAEQAGVVQRRHHPGGELAAGLDLIRRSSDHGRERAGAADQVGGGWSGNGGGFCAHRCRGRLEMPLTP